MLKGGTTRFEVVLTLELEVLAILKGDANSFHPLKGEGGGMARKVLPSLEGGGKKFQSQDFPIL